MYKMLYYVRIDVFEGIDGNKKVHLKNVLFVTVDIL